MLSWRFTVRPRFIHCYIEVRFDQRRTLYMFRPSVCEKISPYDTRSFTSLYSVAYLKLYVLIYPFIFQRAPNTFELQDVVVPSSTQPDLVSQLQQQDAVPRFTLYETCVEHGLLWIQISLLVGQASFSLQRMWNNSRCSFRNATMERK